jgi:hypothetical protein
VPAGHEAETRLQGSLPTTALNVPNGHCEQMRSVDVVGAMNVEFPMPQIEVGMHLVSSPGADLKESLGHGSHTRSVLVVGGAVSCSPTRQSLTGLQKFLVGSSWYCVWPSQLKQMRSLETVGAAAWNCPSWQLDTGLHESWLDVFWKVPTEQPRHWRSLLEVGAAVW